MPAPGGFNKNHLYFIKQPGLMNLRIGSLQSFYMDSFYVEKNFPATAQQPATEKMMPVYEIRFKTAAIRLPLSGFPLEKIHNKATKRGFDIILSVILIITILSWLIPLFAILIKLDSRGPVFFRQKRNRNGGKLFTCIKFRTMVVNEEADLRAARHNDERITGFGKFLRHHHLDELPQLFNVLLGDMSVIGPRPYMVKENLYYESLVEAYSHRHTIKPGITGLAQSFGYFGSLHDLGKVKERVDLDIIYINNWSLGMDVKILYRTFMMAFGFNDQASKVTGINKKF
jgi:lipopolysaccharide/colanic/teichoic acid biosynthesis glycosyltransferase